MFGRDQWLTVLWMTWLFNDVSGAEYMDSSCKIIDESWIRKDVEGVIVSNFDTLSWDLPAGTEETHYNFRISGLPGLNDCYVSERDVSFARRACILRDWFLQDTISLCLHAWVWDDLGCVHTRESPVASI